MKKSMCKRCGSPLKEGQCSNDCCPLCPDYPRDSDEKKHELINLCFTIVCTENDARGIEAAVEACLDSLDGVEGYVSGTEDRPWEDEEGGS